MDYSYPFSDELQQDGDVDRALRLPAEILPTSTRRRPVRSRRDVRLSTRVTAAVFDEATHRWRCRRIAASVSRRSSASWRRCLSTAQVPDFKGRDVRGALVSHRQLAARGGGLHRQRVGRHRTGSSAIQSSRSSPGRRLISSCSQRTRTSASPPGTRRWIPSTSGGGRRTTPSIGRQARESRAGFVVERTISRRWRCRRGRLRAYEIRWSRGGLGFNATFADLLTSKDANDTAADFFRAKDQGGGPRPGRAETLSPRHYPVGTKRLCVDTDYYDTFNRDNVTLIDLRTAPIEAITPTGLRTRDEAYAVDSLVFATGFDAMTGALLSIDIRGGPASRCGRSGPKGPARTSASPSPASRISSPSPDPAAPPCSANMIVSIEHTSTGSPTASCTCASTRATAVEATVEAEDAWVAHVNEVGHATLYPLANSWYMGANIPGKRASSCPTSAASASTASFATTWRRRATRGSR